MNERFQRANLTLQFRQRIPVNSIQFCTMPLALFKTKLVSRIPGLRWVGKNGESLDDRAFQDGALWKPFGNANTFKNINNGF